MRWPVQTGYDTKDTRTRSRKYIRQLRKVPCIKDAVS